MSIAGGYHKAIERAVAAGCDCVQIFTGPPHQWSVRKADLQSGGFLTKNSSQWRAAPISDQQAQQFREAMDRHQLQAAISHASYLINLAAADEALWNKSVAALVVELQRAEQLGLSSVVLHPGAHTVLTEEQGIERIVCGLRQALEQTNDLACRCLLETTAGQGSCIGWQFEQLAAILARVGCDDRLGVCFDSCHLLAAGYPLQPRRKYLATMRQFEEVIGFHRLSAIHLNDSKRPLGSRVDRHDNIGQGCLGLEPFTHIVNDPRFERIPMLLETPKGKTDDGQDWDAVNLATLRSLVRPRRPRRRAK
jgi:deoxyribonuclease-4